MLHDGSYSRGHRSKHTAGYVLAIAIIVSFSMTTIGVYLSTIASAKYSKSQRTSYVSTANYAAEAGLSATIAKLYDDTSATGAGYGAETVFFNSPSVGKATYTIKVDTGPNNVSRTITSIGKMYVPSTASTPISTQYIKAGATLSTTPSNVMGYAGPGGINVAAGSKFQAPTMYSSGQVILNGTGSSIGDSTYNTRLDVANIACLQSGTGRFPYMCLNSNNAVKPNSNSVYATTCASGQTDPAGIIPVGPFAGLLDSCAPARHVISPVNRATLLNNAGITGSAASTSCTTNTTTSRLSGVYNGNITVSNQCKLTLPPIMYIKGDLNVSNYASLVVPDSAGMQQPLVMATGSITIDTAFVTANSSGVSARFISFASTDTGATGCTTVDSCTSFNDDSAGWTKKQNSLSTNAINLINGSQLQGAEFTAYFGNAILGDCIAGAVAAQKITTLANTNPTFRNNASKSVSDLVQARWTVTSYQRVFSP